MRNECLTGKHRIVSTTSLFCSHACKVSKFPSTKRTWPQTPHVDFSYFRYLASLFACTHFFCLNPCNCKRLSMRTCVQRDKCYDLLCPLLWFDAFGMGNGVQRSNVNIVSHTMGHAFGRSELRALLGSYSRFLRCMPALAAALALAFICSQHVGYVPTGRFHCRSFWSVGILDELLLTIQDVEPFH